MSRKLPLKRPTRRRLQKLDRKGPSADVRVRFRVILNVASGLSCNAAAREVGCFPSTAVRTVARFVWEGEASLVDHRSEQGARKASWIFLNLLRALLETHDPAQAIHVILDNYIIHKSEVTQVWLAEFGDRLRLHFLPPYCPNENQIEHLWLDLHANVTRNHRQTTIGALLDCVHGNLSHRFGTRRRLLLVA